MEPFEKQEGSQKLPKIQKRYQRSTYWWPWRLVSASSKYAGQMTPVHLMNDHVRGKLKLIKYSLTDAINEALTSYQLKC